MVTFVAFATDVTDEDGNDLGDIGGGLGVVTISTTGSDGVYLQIPHDELWYAAMEAIEAGDWKRCPPE